MLRTRFTFAVAGAVAAVTLTVTAVAFLVVRADLQNQLKQEPPGRGGRAGNGDREPGRVEVERADEIGRLATSFNTMLQALQRSQAAQRRLVSDASHELRTPLTSLRVNVELLADDPGLSASERQEVLDRVVAQVAELGQLVGSVTELARGEASPGEHGQVDLHEVVAAALASVRRDWPRTVFTALAEPFGVVGSAPRLQVAIRNLLDNAAKFGPPGASVEVSLRAGELIVRDHGPGIAPPTCRMFSAASTGRRRPGPCPVPALGSPSSARWRKATAARSRLNPL